MNNQQQSPASAQQLRRERSEVLDLVDFWRILVRNKILVLIVFCVCTGGAIITALLLPKEYRAEALILPPSDQSVERLNVLKVDGSTANGTLTGDPAEQYFFHVNAHDLYHSLIINLKSSHLQRQFFDQNNIASRLAKEGKVLPKELLFQEQFRRKIALRGLKKGKMEQGFVSVTLRGSDPDQLAKWLNDYIDLADKETISSEIDAFSVRVERTRDSVKQRIASLRATERSRRLDRIARLEEAVKIAGKLGWVDGPSNEAALYERAQNAQVNMMFTLQDVPLYLRGVKALQAEINVLKERTNDDPFIPELRGLQEYLEFLASITPEAENAHAMQVDQRANADTRPIRPKRKLIVTFGLSLGVVLGVFAAFLWDLLLRKNDL